MKRAFATLNRRRSATANCQSVGRAFICAAVVGTLSLVCDRAAFAQSFGIELHNTLMPASGGMGGTSLARPQDLMSAINGNPATLSQFSGTNFEFGGAWVGPTFNLEQTGNVVPDVTPFAAKSGTPGVAAPNIGVTQDLSAQGLPVRLGLGLVSTAGGGVDFRDVPASNGTSSDLLVLNFVGGMSVDLTERLSAGLALSVGNAFFDGPFVGAGAMVPAYGARGAVGLTYLLTPRTTVGFYYQSIENFVFRDAIRLELPNGQFDVARNIEMDLPDNVGIGVANNSLFDGQLLLAADLLYKQWENAALFDTIYRNQWVLQLGSQYSLGRCKLRLGYVYAENPVKPVTFGSAGGITPPGGIPAVDYLQAQLAVICPHRLSAGVGIVDVLPGVDVDFFVGGMFRDTEQLGQFTTVTMESYYIGAGFTWHFGRGRCGHHCGDCDCITGCSS